MSVVLFGSAGLYRGWFPVTTSICCSNFVYFYVFNGLKAVAYKDSAKPYPAKDLVLAFLAGKCAVCCLQNNTEGESSCEQIMQITEFC